MRRAIMPIHPELLIEALHLPPDTEIIGVQINLENGNIEFGISQKDLKDVMQGCHVERVYPKLRIEYGDAPQRVVFEGWGQ